MTRTLKLLLITFSVNNTFGVIDWSRSDKNTKHQYLTGSQDFLVFPSVKAIQCPSSENKLQSIFTKNALLISTVLLVLPLFLTVSNQIQWNPHFRSAHLNAKRPYIFLYDSPVNTATQTSYVRFALLTLCAVIEVSAIAAFRILTTEHLFRSVIVMSVKTSLKIDQSRNLTLLLWYSHHVNTIKFSWPAFDLINGDPLYE